MNFADIIALVEEKADGRSFGSAKHIRWAGLIRRKAARHALVGGFHGLYFLYKEATVDGGSVAGEPRCSLPSDYIEDLSAWYDGKLLVKAPPGVMNITMGGEENTQGDSPVWWTLRGLELELIPAPPETGKEIKLFYNGLPADVSGVGFTDYFLEQWPDLHVFGMSEYALDSIGANRQAKEFRDRFNEEAQRLMMDNRRFWLKNTKIRLMNWDEFVEKQRHVFPQFGNLTV